MNPVAKSAALITLFVGIIPVCAQTAPSPYGVHSHVTRNDEKIVYAFWDSYGRWAKQRKQVISYEGDVPKVFDLYGRQLELEVNEKEKTAVLLPEWGKLRYLICSGRIAVTQ